MDPKDPGELTPDELAGEIAEALPERAAMSTVSMTGLDAATGTVEAVSDGVTETAAATQDPAPDMSTTAAPEVPADAAPPETDATDAPETATTAAPEATTTAATTAAPEATNTAAPEPVQDAPVDHSYGSATAIQHANQHSAVAQHAVPQPPTTAPAADAPVADAPAADADQAQTSGGMQAVPAEATQPAADATAPA